MNSLRDALSRFEPEGDSWAIEAPDGWTQGRTVYGGMTAALSLAALRRAVDAPPPLRSAQIAFVGPASGHLRFRPSILRRGRSVLVVAVDCLAEAGVAARATFVFGEPRASVVRHDDAAAPAVSAPDDCPEFLESQFRPEFLQNFDVRFAAGARPMSGASKAAFTAWARFREDEGDDVATALLAMADCLPAAAMVQFPQRATLSSMTWSIDLFQPVERGVWRLLRSHSEQASDGYSLQSMDLWDQAGRRVAVGRQCVAVFV